MTLLKIPKSLTNSNEMPIKPIKTHLNGNSFSSFTFFLIGIINPLIIMEKIK